MNNYSPHSLISKALPIIDFKIFTHQNNDIILGIDWYTQSLEDQNLLVPFDNLNNLIYLGPPDEYQVENDAIYLNLPIRIQEECCNEIDSLQHILKNAHPSDKIFLYTVSTPKLFTDTLLDQTYIKSSIFYTIPTRPHGLLNWTGCFTRYLNYLFQKTNNNHNDITSIHCIQYTDYNEFVSDKHIKNIHDYSEKDNILATLIRYFTKIRQIRNHIIKNILSVMQNNQKYYFAYNALLKVNSYYYTGCHNNNFTPYYKLLEYPKRFELLTTTVPDKLFISNYTEEENIFLAITHPNYSVIDKKREMIKIIKLLIESGEQWKISHLISSMFQQLITQLYSSITGKIAHDEKLYSYNHSEWYFISNLKAENFHMDNNGYLSIIHYHETKAYQDYYAINRDNYHIFQDEMIHLMNLLGLTFINNINFHEQITFDKESSNTLINLGFTLFNLDNIKKNIYNENTWSFFRNKTITRHHNSIHFFDLPGEIIGLIRFHSDDLRPTIKVNDEQNDMQISINNAKKRKTDESITEITEEPERKKMRFTINN